MKTLVKSSLVLSTVFLSHISLSKAVEANDVPTPQPPTGENAFNGLNEFLPVTAAVTQVPETAYSNSAATNTATTYPEWYFYNIATGASAVAPDGSVPFYNFSYYTDDQGYTTVTFTAPVNYTLVLAPGTPVALSINQATAPAATATTAEAVVGPVEQTSTAPAASSEISATTFNTAYDYVSDGVGYIDSAAQEDWNITTLVAQAAPASFVVTTVDQDRAFIQQISAEAQAIAAQYNLYASVMIAQALWESHAGTSTLSAAPHHNLFGIKGDYYGSKVTFQTIEDDGTGNLLSVYSDFRSYPSYSGSLEDYAQLLRSNIYVGTWKENAASYLDATAALTGVYATDITYADKINAVITAYNLTQYDN